MGTGSIRYRARRVRGWRLLRRSPLLWWAAAAVLGALTAMVIAQSVGRANAESARWGRTQAVWVMRHAVPAGMPLADGDAVVERRPRGLVPAGALDAGRPPFGRAARIELARGEVLIATRLAGGGVTGLSAAVAADRLGVGIPGGPGMPPVRVGDRVDVLATFEVGDSGGAEGAAESPPSGAPPSFAVAVDGEVLAVSAATITVAVDSVDAPRVAFAVAKGAVTLALRGPHPPRVGGFSGLAGDPTKPPVEADDEG